MPSWSTYFELYRCSPRRIWVFCFQYWNHSPETISISEPMPCIHTYWDCTLSKYISYSQKGRARYSTPPWRYLLLGSEAVFFFLQVGRHDKIADVSHRMEKLHYQNSLKELRSWEALTIDFSPKFETGGLLDIDKKSWLRCQRLFFRFISNVFF